MHALKSSARIIGAAGLAELAAALEDAGNREDRGFIDENTNKLMSDYESFKDKLWRIKNDEASDEEKEPIPKDVLDDAYSALNDCIPQMDYDAVEMILEELSEYILPDEDKDNIGRLSDMLKVFDWDGMEEWIGNIVKGEQ